MMKKINQAMREINNTTNIFAPAKAYWCCQGCGSAEAWECINDSQTGKNGYLFYHEQDKDDHYEKGEGYLSYGYYTEDKKDIEMMIERVKPIFEKYGIEIKWNGDIRTRLLAVDKNKK